MLGGDRVVEEAKDGDGVDEQAVLVAQDGDAAKGRSVATKRGCAGSKNGAEDQGSCTDGGPAETVVVEDRPVKLARLRQDPQEYAKSMQSKNTVLSTKYGFKTYNETMKAVAKHLKQKHYDLHEVPAEELPDRLASFPIGALASGP